MFSSPAAQVPFPESKFRVQAGSPPFAGLPRLAWIPEYGPCPPLPFFFSASIHSRLAWYRAACPNQVC
ncbi:hypothetical protein CGRA01v4_04755 [Colletotrichum graminicola]|nr:hypothetical protein CGRA01v4_04755 [Colletotrichum graminicola]